MKTDDLISLLASDGATARAAAQRARQLSVLALLGGVLGAIAAFQFAVGLRADLLESRTILAVLRKEAVTLGAALAGLALVWELSRPDARAGRFWLLPAGILAALVAWELLTMGRADWARRLVGSNGAVCLTTIPLLALAPLAALLVGLRQRAPASATSAGAAAGLAASGLGATLYALHCTDDSMLFVGFWYLLATAIVCTLGALAGRAVLRW